MASTVYNGTNLILSVIADGGTLAAVGHTTSCTISLTNDMADATTKDSSGFSESIAGLISGEISFDGLMDYTDSNGGTELAGFLLGRTKVDFSYGTSTTGDTLYTGEGFLTGLEITGEMESAVTYSGTIQITGTITASVNS
jgi:predicted secreted protein